MFVGVVQMQIGESEGRSEQGILMRYGYNFRPISIHNQAAEKQN